MDIVIISEFCEDFSPNDNDRFLFLAKKLMACSTENKVELITSSFRHTTKQHRRESAANWSFSITFVEEPGYPKNVCIKRFFSHYSWGKNLIKYLKSRKNKPDVVYCAIPSLTGPYNVAKYCEKEHIKFIIDVQDLWPEAFMMVMNIPILSKIVFEPFYMIADGIYRRADVICAVSDTYGRRACKKNKKTDSFCSVFLGTELTTFDLFSARVPLLQKKDDEIWLAYCGTLGKSYDITCVIDSLYLLNNPKIRFIIMGDGPRLDEFKEYSKLKSVNAEFLGRLKYDQMCSILSICDIAINPITHMSAASIINKHADYAAAGIPVINTQESIEYRALVEKYKMGFNCINNNASDMADKIKLLVSNKELRLEMGKNARECASQMFDREHTYKKLCDVVLNMES